MGFFSNLVNLCLSSVMIGGGDPCHSRDYHSSDDVTFHSFLKQNRTWERSLVFAGFLVRISETQLYY